MTVLILGLRRSGTTAFWETWRQDERFVCYNEPFNPLLRRAGDPSWPDLHGGYREFHSLYERDPARFWTMFAPIDRHGELQDSLSDKQRHYLEWLIGQSDHVCTDLTRAHFKLGSLHAACPEAVVVHLYRPPQNWVTSVTLPSTGHFNRQPTWRLRAFRKLQMAARKVRFRQRFWGHTSGYRFKGFEELIGTYPGSAFGVRLQQAGLDPEAVYQMPAVYKLLAFWKLHYDHVEQAGPALFGDRFVSVNFNDFCRAPAAVMADVYSRAGETPPAMDYSRIHPPPPSYAAGDPRWTALLDALALPHLD